MDWFTMPLETVPKVLLSVIGIYIAVILFTRISGLRSFSKMSSFDFAMTIAIGSLMATTITTQNPPLLQGIVALAGLYIIQMMIAWLRRKGYSFIKVVDNQPLLLMKGPHILQQNLIKSNVTHDDLLQKLREENVIDFNQVKAVIFETTGDVTVLHSNDQMKSVDFRIIENVIDADELEPLISTSAKSEKS